MLRRRGRTVIAVLLAALVSLSTYSQIDLSNALPKASSPEGGVQVPGQQTPPPPLVCVPVLCNGEQAPTKYDVTGDCKVTSEDAQAVINFINTNGSGRVQQGNERYDTNGDQFIAPIDVLVVVNLLNSSGCNATPTPTPTVTPTATLTPTNTPTPTATSTQQDVCGYYQVNVVHDGNSGLPQTIFDPGEDTPPCLDNIFKQAEAFCQPLKDPCANKSIRCNLLMSTVRQRTAYDDCVVGAVLMGNSLFFDPALDEYWAWEGKQIGGPGWAFWAHKTLKDAGVAPPQVPLLPFKLTNRTCEATAKGAPGPGEVCYFREGTVYLDRECKPVEPKGTLCSEGNFHWRASPISLEWTGKQKIGDTLSITSFSLAPNTSKKHFIWKGSSENPLLVYDPNHRGEITSAQQLFGEWTFGGRRHASLEGPQASGAWSNGFEALASLDVDGDSRLQGAELDDLGLWFDGNRDGVSQVGEVVSARTAGLQQLLLGSVQKDASSGDLFVEQGFVREDGGKEHTGRMVDWYGEGSTSKQELINKYLLRGVGRENNSSVASDTVGDEAASTSSTDEFVKLSELAGAWNFRATEDSTPSQDTSGILVFRVMEDGRLRGHSLIETKTMEQKVGFGAVLSILPVEGKATLLSDGTVKVEFSVKASSGTRVTNSAVLRDGKLEGGAEAFVPVGKATVSLPYRWAAERR